VYLESVRKRRGLDRTRETHMEVVCPRVSVMILSVYTVVVYIMLVYAGYAYIVCVIGGTPPSLVGFLVGTRVNIGGAGSPRRTPNNTEETRLFMMVSKAVTKLKLPTFHLDITWPTRLESPQELGHVDRYMCYSSNTERLRNRLLVPDDRIRL
jgi:hypothetical protein